MTSNDSGVDSSNDSNDSTAIPVTIDLSHAFANQLNEGFTLPQTISLDEPTRQNINFAFHQSEFLSSHYKMRQKVKRHRNMLHPRIIEESRERRLRLAASTCNIELLTRLLEVGTNPNCSDEHERSPLHLAACRGYAEIVAQLLKYGANPNIVDSLGNTPLHLAVISASSNNFNSVAKLLLGAGASVHVLDRSGKNPLELAKSKFRLIKSRYKNPTQETAKILKDMNYLMLKMVIHSSKEKKDIEDISALERRLQNLSTADQIVSEGDNLLACVQRLSITK